MKIYSSFVLYVHCRLAEALLHGVFMAESSLHLKYHQSTWKTKKKNLGQLLKLLVKITNFSSVFHWPTPLVYWLPIIVQSITPNVMAQNNTQLLPTSYSRSIIRQGIANSTSGSTKSRSQNVRTTLTQISNDTESAFELTWWLLAGFSSSRAVELEASVP